MKASTRFAAVLVMAAIYCLAFAPSATADPEPFTVTPSGVTLTKGTFEENGHVNARYTVDGVEHTASLHLDPLNGQPGGAWIGSTTIPWTALGIPATGCISWAQVHPFNYHYGEQNEAPVCLSTTPPTSPAPSPEPDPSTPTTTPSPYPSPTTEPSPSPSPSTGIGTPEYPPTSTPTPGNQAPTPTEPAPTTSPREGLAVTGPNEDRFLFGTAATILVVAGIALIYVLDRRRRS